MAIRKYEVIPATLEHAKALQGRLRKSDLQEIEASTGRDPDKSLERAWRVSELCWAGLIDGRVVALFGVARLSVLSETGSPWLLGSEEMESAAIEVGRRSRQYVREMKRHFVHLENFIDARQETSIRWLKWCGFTIDPAAPWGVLRLPFHRFWMNCHV